MAELCGSRTFAFPEQSETPGCTEVSLSRFGDREPQEHELRFWVICEHQQAQSSGVLSSKQGIIDRIDTAMDVQYHDGNQLYCAYPAPYLDSLFVAETLRLERVDVHSV